MMYAQNSLTMFGESSPVNAPFSSQCMFCAPRPISEPVNIGAIAGNEVDGGHNTFSTSAISRNGFSIAATSSRASAEFLFIFQLPATNGFLMMLPQGSFLMISSANARAQSGALKSASKPFAINRAFSFSPITEFISASSKKASGRFGDNRFT